jgi:hypothetical protein
MDEDTDQGSAWLLAYLAVVRPRPGMYIGNEDVRTLAMYVRGYCDGRLSVGFPAFPPDEASILHDFERWMRNRLQGGNNFDWPMLVGLVDDSSRNLQTFYALFDEFLQSAGIAWPRAEHAELRKRWFGKDSA